MNWHGLGLVLGEVASAFRVVFEALSETLRHENPTPDLTDLDHAIARLRLAIDKRAGNPVLSHNAVVLPFVVDTLRRDLGDLTDALARSATT